MENLVKINAQSQGLYSSLMKENLGRNMTAIQLF
jgi:hypothetical protein